jgi:rapamycin-insensitive companion of mTOR
LYLCLYDMAAVKSLVGVLRIPELDTRVSTLCYRPCRDLTKDMQEIVLDFFFDLFNIKTPKWYQTFIDGRRLSSACIAHIMQIDR